MPVPAATKDRRLTATELGLTETAGDDPPDTPDTPPPPDPALDPLLPNGHPLYQTVRRLLVDRQFAGVVLAGPPGTSKSHFARLIADKLAGGVARRVRAVQFHPSFQYEDFVQGFVPKRDGSGFRMRTRVLLQMSDAAVADPDNLHILLIDELSRADPARVFGEALTYVEMSKRNRPFRLASGRETVIPPNLRFLATMNVYDKGVDEVDAAFDRRFATVEMSPDRALLTRLLDENGMVTDVRDRVLDFFAVLQSSRVDACRLGHTYFLTARDEADLREVWDYQLKFVLKKAARSDAAEYSRLEGEWLRRFPPPADASGD